jgi:hypothetical protein
MTGRESADKSVDEVCTVVAAGQPDYTYLLSQDYIPSDISSIYFSRPC